MSANLRGALGLTIVAVIGAGCGPLPVGDQPECYTVVVGQTGARSNDEAMIMLNKCTGET